VTMTGAPLVVLTGSVSSTAASRARARARDTAAPTHGRLGRRCHSFEFGGGCLPPCDRSAEAPDLALSLQTVGS
jgi:hypothetical protein